MPVTGVKRPADEESNDDQFDYNLLRRQLSQSTINSVGTSNSEVWPLQLNTTSVEHYIFGDVIGHGSFAEVRECINTNNLERCAIKIVNKDHLVRQAPEALLKQMQEIKLLRRFKHPNIIEMKECLFKGSRVYIILEHCSFVLSDLLAEQPDRRMCLPITRFLFHQLCLGLEYLHSIGIVHRDIKPQNLLITNCGTLKIIDFGVSQILSMWSKVDTCENYEGSPLFQAPEVVAGKTEYAGFKVDVWSSGVTLYLMLYGHYPFFDDSLLGLYDIILGEPYKKPRDAEHIPCQSILSNLLDMMLEKVASKRASMDQVLEHPWLKFQSLLFGDEHSEFVDMVTARYHDTHSLISLAEENVPQKSENYNSQRDIYRSMTVLPYLYRHHFPDIKIRRGSSTATTPAAMSPASSSTANSTTTSPDCSENTSPVNSSNPHEILDDHEVEWGTSEQYSLMKVPLIRANRIRHLGRKSSHAKRRRRHHEHPVEL